MARERCRSWRWRSRVRCGRSTVRLSLVQPRTLESSDFEREYSRSDAPTHQPRTSRNLFSSSGLSHLSAEPVSVAAVASAAGTFWQRVHESGSA